MPSHLSSADLDSVLETAIIGAPMAQGARTLGIEVERLILHRRSRECAPLGFCRELIEGLAADIGGTIHRDGGVVSRVEGDGYSFSMEPGGQLELATLPRTSLAEIESTMSRVRAVVHQRLHDTDYELVALGHAPVSPVDSLGLLPRSRYRIMDSTMIRRGRLSRHMMRATAGFQLAYDFDDRQDAGAKLALLYRLAPVMLAITANSRMVEGVDSGFASFRHYVWLHTDHSRVGVPEGCLHAETAVDGYLEFAKNATVLFLRRDGDLVEAPQKSLVDLVADGIVTHDDLELHLTSLFPHVRIRNYLEVRYFDSVDWVLARSVLALLSGIVYCPTATARAVALSDCLVPTSPAALRELHLAAATDALDARAPDGRSLRELARELLEYSATTLGGDNCKWAERVDLDTAAEHIG